MDGKVDHQSGLQQRVVHGAMSWRDRWMDLRNRLLLDRRFQRAAVVFPLTRPIARRRARQVFDLCAGFVYSQVLFACVRFRLLDALRDGPADKVDLSRVLGLSADATDRLLKAAATLGLVDRRSDERYGLGMHGAALLANPGVLAMIDHHPAFYADMADPVALLRGELAETKLSQYWPYARGGGAPIEQSVTAYTRLMSESQALVAEDILDAYPFGQHVKLLDVGGGNGTFLSAAARRFPNLKLMLFDLPGVARLAVERLKDANLQARSEVAAGDFCTDELPRGADVITLVRVVHDHDDALVRTLLRKIHAALPSGGRIVIAEPLAETPGAEAVGHVYFAFYLLAMGSGRPRTSVELTSLLCEAGFSNIRRLATRMPLQVSVIAADRP